MASSTSSTATASATASVITVTAPPSTTFYLPTGITAYFLTNPAVTVPFDSFSGTIGTGQSTASQSALSSLGSAVLQSSFQLFLTLTATSPPAQVDLSDCLTAAGNVGGQSTATGFAASTSGEIWYLRSQDPYFYQPVGGTTFVLTSGVTLLVPVTAALPSSVDLRAQLSAMSNVPQTAVASTTTSPPGPTSPAPAPTPTPTPTPETPGPNVGAIAGGVVGGVAGLAIIVIVVLLLWRRQRQRNGRPSPEPTPVLSEVGQPGTPGFQGSRSPYSPNSFRTSGMERQSGGW